MIADGIANSSRSVDSISRVLSDSIRTLDKEIQDGVTGLFANDVDALAKLSEDAVDDIVRENHEKLLLGMTGTTALIALVDKKKENLWIANLGDCQAGVCLIGLVNDVCPHALTCRCVALCSSHGDEIAGRQVGR